MSRWRARKVSASPLFRDAATSLRLSKVRQRGTAPELMVRALLWSMGLRYRLNNRSLHGTPDISNRKRRWAVFVHGCFWHAHTGCARATTPKRNRAFWRAKFAVNRVRDARAVRALRRGGYRVVVVWACELDDKPTMVERRLRSLLR